MTNRRTVVVSLAAATVAAVTVGAAIGLTLGDDPSTTDPSSHSSSGPRTAGTTNAPAGSSSDSADSRQGTSSKGGSESLPDPGSSESPAAPGSGSTPAMKGGVKIVPEAPGTSAYALPGLGDGKRTPLPTWADLPTKAVFAQGRLVAGYPARLLPQAPGGSVVTSSVSPSKERVQVALVGVRGGHRDRVLRFYRAKLTSAGFKETSVAAVGGSAAAAFTRGPSRVVVTVGPTGEHTYSVVATLVIGKA